ncbi:MAG: ATP-binding protein [Candidatus Saccharimonas aalborgensis]
MTKIVLTGGPHTGKTSLLEAYARFDPTVVAFPEPASVVLAEHHGEKGYSVDELIANPEQFCGACLEVAHRQHQSVADDSIAVFDRGVADTIVYAQMAGLDGIADRAAQSAKIAAYDTVILCEFVGTYGERFETIEQAMEIHQRLAQLYKELGIRTITMPDVAISERVGILHQIVKQAPRG